MKKSSLTTAVVAGIAGAAGLVSVSNAVNINPDGTGQVLVYPYYTVNNGLATLISVVNTTNDVKAVKVRFLEGRNSQEVLDFNLYLSPFDVWTGAVLEDASGEDGPARLFTDDTTCTVPDIDAAGVPFRNFQYANINNDGGPFGLDRTREGHIELIEMGRVVDNGDVSPTAGASVEAVDPVVEGGTANLATSATHNSAGVPNNCGRLIAAWNPNGGALATWTNSGGAADIDEPNGGLFGGASIVDVAGGSNLSYNADAIDGFYTIEDSAALHSFPGTTEPALDDAETSPGIAEARIFDNGTLITLEYDAGFPDAVSAVFMHDAIFNEYVTDPAIGAASEWVVTFPTKLLHLQLTAGQTPGGRLPFTQVNQTADSAADQVLAYRGNASGVPVGACEPISIDFYDREEQVANNIPAEIEFSPPAPSAPIPGLSLCYEAQVITFNQPTAGEVLAGNDASAVLGSRYPRNINLCEVFGADGSCQGDAFQAGWVRMEMGDEDNFLDSNAIGGATVFARAFGLPVTGFWAADYVNANVSQGVLANYSGLHKHRGSRDGETALDATGASTGFTWS